MSAEHRKPAVAFAVLALVATTLVGFQRADAQAGRLLVAVAGATVHVQGTLPAEAARLVAPTREDRPSWGPAFDAVVTDAHDHAREGARGDRGTGPLGTLVVAESVHRPAPKDEKKRASRRRVATMLTAEHAGSGRTAAPATKPADAGRSEAGDQPRGNRSQPAPGGADHDDDAEPGDRAASRRVQRAQRWAEHRAERLARGAERLEREVEGRASRAAPQAPRPTTEPTSELAPAISRAGSLLPESWSTG